MKPIEPAALFAFTSIPLAGVVPWGEPVPYTGSGVYVITAPEAGLDQHVVYIGRASRLRRRLSQFYRHLYGRTSPHRGGQEILLLAGRKLVHWGAAEDYVDAEHRLLDAFERSVGRKPLGNRIRSARIKI